jgi:hypothetical protein
MLTPLIQHLRIFKQPKVALTVSEMPVQVESSLRSKPGRRKATDAARPLQRNTVCVIPSGHINTNCNRRPLRHVTNVASESWYVHLSMFANVEFDLV